MEPSEAIQPCKLQFISSYGEAINLDDTDLRKLGIRISGSPISQTTSSFITKESKSSDSNGKTATSSASNGVPLDKSETEKPNIAFRFQREQASECGLSVDQLCFIDPESTADLKLGTAFTSGVHIWEFIFPICISNVEFGVMDVSSGKKYSIKTKSCNPCVVTAKLDLERHLYSTRVENNPLTEKAISLDSQGPFTPFVSTQKSKAEVIINPYPRLNPSQITLGAKFSKIQFIKDQLKNTIAISHLPRGFSVNNDSAFINLYAKKREEDIKSVYMPRDNSHFRALRGWAIVELSSEAACQDWTKLQVSAEGRGMVITGTQELIKYALDQTLQSKLRSENLQLAQHIWNKFNQPESPVTDADVLRSFDEFYQKYHSGCRALSEPSQDNIDVRYLKSCDKLLLVTQSGLAKLASRDSEGCFRLDNLSFDQSPQKPTELIRLYVSKNQLDKLFDLAVCDMFVGKHQEMARLYSQFLRSATDTLTYANTHQTTLAFTSTFECAKAVIDDLLFSLSKLSAAKLRESDNLPMPESSCKATRSATDSNRASQFGQFQAFSSSISSLTAQDVNTLLNILNNLSEQMWCRSVFGTSPKECVNAFACVSRPHSALDRLSTFVASGISLHSLADLGFVWRGDEVVQSVFNSHEEIREISEHCIDPIASRLALKNNVNCELQDSLNYIPPTALSSKANIIVSDCSDLLFDCAEDEGVCRIYSLDLGLVELGKLDFSVDASDSIDDALESRNALNYHQCYINHKLNRPHPTSRKTGSGQQNKLKSGGGSSKAKGSKTKPKKTAKAQIFDEEVCDISGLFGNPEDEFEDSTNANNENAKEEPVEETKCSAKVDGDSKADDQNAIPFIVLGFSVLINQDYLSSDCQAYVTCVYEQESKFKVCCRAVHLNIRPEHLEFSELSANTADQKTSGKKKAQESVISRIVAQQRTNILHRTPFFSPIIGGSEPPLIVAEQCCTCLSELFTKILCISKINHKLDDSRAIYILGVTNSNKVAAQKLTIDRKEGGIEFVASEVAEIGDFSEGTSYSIISEDAKVCVVSDGAIICLNPSNLCDKQVVAVDGKPQLHCIGLYRSHSYLGEKAEGVRVVQVQPESSQGPDTKPAEAKTDNAEEIVEPKVSASDTNEQEESPVQQDADVKQSDVSLELLTEGDCDLSELQKVFSSRRVDCPFSKSKQGWVASIPNLKGKAEDSDSFEVRLILGPHSSFPAQNSESTQKTLSSKSDGFLQKSSPLMLKVHSSTGGHKNSAGAHQLLVDQKISESYISNYPRPTFVFTHDLGAEFIPTKFSISSKFNRERSNSDAYPVGAGLVFCANSLEAFCNLQSYYRIQTKAQYDSWLAKRKEIGTPLKESEPAAYFSLGGEREVTVCIEASRTSYVLLMPTDFRKKPIKFTQKFNANNCEIETFKVWGIEVEPNQHELSESEVSSSVSNAPGSVAVVEALSNGEWTEYARLQDLRATKIESWTSCGLANQKGFMHPSSTSASRLFGLKQGAEAIRVRIESTHDDTSLNLEDCYLATYRYPSSFTFNSKGLNRITAKSIREVYRDVQKCKVLYAQLLAYVHNKCNPEHTRLNLADVITLDFRQLLEDPDLYSYSDDFKAEIFKTIKKIGLADANGSDTSFFDYAKDIINQIQTGGVPSFDITSVTLIYSLCKTASKEMFDMNYKLLTDFIFKKALPELESSKQYYPVDFDATQSDFICPGALVCRDKAMYELTSDLGTLHSLESVRLFFGEDTLGLSLAMRIRIYAVDHEDNEVLVLRAAFDSGVYRVLTRAQDSESSLVSEARNHLTISLRNENLVTRYIRIKIHHICGHAQSKMSPETTPPDPSHAIVASFRGQDTGVSARTNDVFKASKSEVHQTSFKLENVVRLGGVDYNCFQKSSMCVLTPKKVDKKELKSVEEHVATQRLLSAKSKEAASLLRSRDYDGYKALQTEMKQLKTKARSKLAKFNNMTLSETLILSDKIMNYLASSEFNGPDSKYGISTLPESEQYELLKSIVEWYLLPMSDVGKVISLKSANAIIESILKNTLNAHSVFFDLVERLLRKRNQAHKKVFKTLEPFIKEVHISGILNELLSRLGLSRNIQEKSVDSTDKIREAIQESKVYDKESLWVIVGTLQVIYKRLQKASIEEKKECLIDLLLLCTLRLNASDRDHTMYYKLLLSLMRECFKDKASDCAFFDATLPVKAWFNVLTLSTDPELYSQMLKFIEDLVLNSSSNKKKANEFVHNILVWYSDLNGTTDLKSALSGTIFQKTYELDPNLFSTHYCQSIDLFLATFRAESDDANSNKLVSDIFTSILQTLVKPLMSFSFAKIWNELFKCLAIVGTNDETIDRFVGTFLSLPGDVQDNLYTHFEVDNVSLDSAKKNKAMKFTVPIIYKILRSFMKKGLRDDLPQRDQLRVYTICDDLICKLATNEPCDVNYLKSKTPVVLTEDEYMQTLDLFNEYLNCYMNKGYYNHMAGASYLVLSRLKMGVHLSYLVYNSELNGKRLFDEFVDNFNHVSVKDKAKVFEKQILWLLLNNPNSKGKSDPCSMNHSQIVKTIIEKLPKKRDILLELVPMVMKQIIKFDSMVLSNCHKICVERSSAFQNSSNTIISLLFNACFQDKELFNDFLVKMNGFDFLLLRLFSKPEGIEDAEETIDTRSEQLKHEDSEVLEDLFDEADTLAETPSKEVAKEKSKEKKGIDKVNLTDAGKTMVLIQSSIGVETQTQDWVQYKNGQRNRIIYKHIDKTCRSDFIMMFECTDVIEVSDIQMGLIYYWGNYDQDMHYEPMQVFCEGGMSKAQIDWSVPLRLADDGGYRQSAVNVYGANFSSFSSLNYDTQKYQEDSSSMIADKLNEKQQVHRAKYITFRLRRPEICCLESSMFSSVLSKTMSYGFTFFSVQGVYPDNYPPIRNALLDVQKENTLEILSQCCSGNLSETFGIIANDSAVIDGFKNSIGKLSQLLDQKEYLIKPIFIALCSQNTEMADWIIDKFLDVKASPKQLCLIREIITKDKDKALERIKRILTFIFDFIDSDDTKSIEPLSDIIKIFTFFHGNNFACSYNPHIGTIKDVDIEYNVKSIDAILNKAVDCSPEIQEVFYSFILFLFELAKPQKDGPMSTEDIVDFLLDSSEESSEEKMELKFVLASTLCATSKHLSSIILAKEDILKCFLGIQSNDLAVWKKRTKFWYNCAQENSVKQYLADRDVPTQIFATFRKYFRPDVEDCVSDAELNKLIVNFISTVAAGNEKIEKDIAAMLKEDIQIACSHDGLDYLNAIVIPLLHSEDTVPVTIFVGDREQDKVEYRQIYYKPKDTSSENKFLFSSSILSKSQEGALMRMFKEHVSEYHDSYDKLIQKKWNLIAEDDSPKKGDFQKISDKISEKSNTLHLIKCTINGESAVFGGFCGAQFPSLAGLQSDYNYELPHDESNFTFYYKGDMENHFVMTNNKPFGYIYTDYELGGVISISGDFVLCSWSINYSHTAGNIYNMKCIEQPGFASFYNNIQVERYECWHVDLGNPNMSNLNNEKSAYFSFPFYKSCSPFNHLTENVVFHVPKAIKAVVLSCELFGRKQKLTIKGQEVEIDLSKSIGETAAAHPEGFCSNILHLAYERPAKEDEQSKEEAKEVLKIIESYEPKYPVLEKFDGAEELIKACQKAVQGWGNRDLREAWDQWLKEVMSFISFPQFFTRLTSDRNNSTLFFDILSGVPERDTKEALKKREKDIEKKKQYQYNYKPSEFENEWINKQLEVVKLTYNLVQRIFEEDKDSEELRQMCLQNGIINTLIERVGLLTCEAARVKVQDKDSEDENEETIMTRVGYTTDIGQEWNVNLYLKKKESKNSQITNIIGIIKGIIMSKELSAKYKLKELILESALLPVLENAFRSGSILEMSKETELFTAYLDFTLAMSANNELTALLMDIGNCYEPPQTEPIYKLLEKLTTLADIFLKALSTEKDDVTAHEDSIKPRKLAEHIKEVNKIVQDAVSSALRGDEEQMGDILKLDLPQKYRKLISPLRFGYMSMKSSPGSSSYTHYFSYNISQETSIENSKIVRLAQEMADLSNALPNEHTNAIFVRVDESRVDVMKAIICGAAATPYAHGCFEYDIFFDSRYPNTPPKCQLVTTGSGAVRFNPNLYADGKVCLSLLGTWRGNSTENWDAKISTVLQVLMSIQAIIMSEEVYYNEPGYEHEAGTTEGEAKNEAYSNIVRYCNIQYAMIDQMLSPSKGFEDAIRTHFFLKRDEILEEVRSWLVYAEENKASYSSLVECHNHSWCQKFKEEGKYKSMLKDLVDKLEQTFKGLSVPTLEHELRSEPASAEKPEASKAAQTKETEESKTIANEKILKVTAEDSKLLEEVDMEDDTEVKTGMEIDVEADAVKDRWSRYIGAMGIDAVSKQANARVLVFGLGGLGAEICKNIVLAGVKELTLCDPAAASYKDLASNFFLCENDIGNNRATACAARVSQLNHYVKVSISEEDLQTIESIERANVSSYSVLILTEASLDTQKLVDDFCRSAGVKFIAADVNGVFSRVFNDFGDEFEVVDKDDTEIKELVIKSITNEPQGLVTLEEGFRHPFQDGDEVFIDKVEGMVAESPEEPSINCSVHKVITVTPSSFRIGDTSKFSDYQRSGLARSVKSKLKLSFKSLKDIKTSEIPFDENLLIADFDKLDHSSWSHYCYEIMDRAKKSGNYYSAKTWHSGSYTELRELFQQILCEILSEDQAIELLKNEKFEKFISKYCVVYNGSFNPLCAFIGGIVSQEAIKAITHKFVPIRQFLYYNAVEIVPDFRFDSEEHFEEDMKQLEFISDVEDRYTGLRACIGNKLLGTIQEANIFMIGAGAIGCELMKNYALLGIGSKKDGSVILTDPDIIEVSNLNRQFLFREKHLRKPKSVTAAAAAIHMNPEMKGKIVAKLDKIHKGTEDTYSLKFYKSLSCITNALDNVQARRFLDGQAVRARIPLIDSGTLGPKGHVQVVLPNMTETYSSTNDPEDTTEIPHCTLKMFPEETLHCVEWAKDLFMQLFSQSAKSYNKIIEDEELYDPSDSDQKKIVKEALSLIEDRPTDFKSCIRWARLKFNQYFNLDILHLLHAYPLDHTTKDGKPFWSLPKRAPEVLKFDSENELHARFIAAAACLRARVFHVEIPFKAPREKEAIMKMASQANEYGEELPEFKPDKTKTEQMKAEVDEENKESGDKGADDEEEETITFGEDFDEIKEFVLSLRKTFRDKKDKPEESKLCLVIPQEFEKDDDTNFHIDFIYACANCRSSNYVLDPMDWITTKIKAGRIIPALATTTSSIAGLQTLELIKILNGSKLEEIKNANLNLAVPSLMVSEPGPPKKTKLKADLEVSAWDVWTCSISADSTLRKLIKTLEEKYGLKAKDIFKDGHPVYLHVLDSVQQLSKIDKTLKDVLKISPSETEVEIMVTFEDPSNSEKILDGVPPIVVKLE